MSEPMQSPEPPRNVRIEYRDGTVVPLELTYVGVEDGQHVWQVVSPPNLLLHNGDALTMNELPANTSIQMDMQSDRLPPGPTEASHHVETWIIDSWIDQPYTYGWQCFTCGLEKGGFNDWRQAEVAADEHRTKTKAEGS
jgi:hypothetical protein